jgi:UDP-3-O-[3-hydroxymyristoyl] glucosamine N-acyltransferase
MRLKNPITLKEAAELLGCSFLGDEQHMIHGFNEIHRVQEGDLVFVDHPKYYDKAIKSSATTILIDKEVAFPTGKGLLISSAPFDDYNRLTKHFSPVVPLKNAVGSNTTIHPSATIYPNVTIGNDVTIGKNAVIHAGVVLMDRTEVGENVIIGPNSVIGHSAFYYKKKPTGFDRMHSCGGVRIHKNAELGASCTIDAGVSDWTVIGEGTKIDNQVHIGHDTVIGKHCLFAANVGIAGCVTIEDHVTFWGQVGCASDVVIGEHVVVLAQSGISKSLAPNKSYFGSPCKDVRLMYREMAALRRLPEFLENL